MIGNREINQRERSAYWGLLESKKTKLPRSVVALIQRVSTLNSKIEVGFSTTKPSSAAHEVLH